MKKHQSFLKISFKSCPFMGDIWMSARGQRCQTPLEQESQTILSYPMWVLWTNLLTQPRLYTKSPRNVYWINEWNFNWFFFMGKPINSIFFCSDFCIYNLVLSSRWLLITCNKMITLLLTYHQSISCISKLNNNFPSLKSNFSDLLAKTKRLQPPKISSLFTIFI